ncbi:MAG: molybdopterin molybdotransferase MoeA, partial [Actinomyces bowdenii]|nr:molybdopterin molybdotransferase MoeA [Actinomyces bowdenii]
MTMLAPEDYLTQVLHGLEPPPPVEVPLSQAHGLVLAEDVAAAVAVPPWTNSAMDGYALRAQDAAGAGLSHPVRLPVAGDVPAGSAPQPLAAGTAQRIMTGAMLPPGADTVVRVEDTDQEPGPAPLPQEVEIRRAIHRGQHVRRSGEDLGAGAPVLGRGSILSARALAALASTGLGAVRAWPRVRVAVVSTGAELREPGQDLEPGTIPDSNGLLLAGLVAEHGAQCTAVLRSPDTAAELAALLVQAAEEADLVITSGGVSAGAFDPLTEIAAAGQDGRQDPAPTGSGPAHGYSPTAGAA